MNKQTRQGMGVSCHFNTQSERFLRVRDYALACMMDGTAYEDPLTFIQELGDFLEPLYAHEIRYIHDLANAERAILKRDGEAGMKNAEDAYDRVLRSIQTRCDKALDDLLNNPEERAVMKEIEYLNSIELTEDNAEEHNRRMREALKKAAEIMEPETRKSKLKKAMNEAVFGVAANYRDEMIIPLRRMGQTREKREAIYQAWRERHYD